MYVRGKGVEFAEVVRIIREVSEKHYEGNVIVHQDAGPIRRYSCTYGCGNPNCRAKGSENGYGFRGRIRTVSSREIGSRRSWSGRRMPAACWHANRDVMRAIFAKYPHAVITTAMARYEGAAGFESTYPGTANVNIGSMMQPAYMPDLCDCAE